MPQRPLQTLDLLPYLFAQHRITVHQTFAILVQHRQPHRHMKPVQNMRGLRTHLQLKRTKRVVAVCQKGISWFICKPCECNTSYKRRFGFVSSVCTKPKRLLEGALSASFSVKLSVLLPTMTSKLCFLANQLRTSPPSMPPVNAPSGRGKRSQSPGLPSIKHWCSSPSSASMRLATLSVS